MAQVLIRDLDAKVVNGLKQRAKKNRRSMQSELKMILEEAAGLSKHNNLDAFLAQAKAIRAHTTGQVRTDSAALIREDRQR